MRPPLLFIFFIFFVLFFFASCSCSIVLSGPAFVPPTRYIARYLRPGLLALPRKRGLYSLKHKAASKLSPRCILSSQERLTNGDEGSNFVVPASSDCDRKRSRPTSSTHSLESCTSHRQRGLCCPQHCYQQSQPFIPTDTPTIAVLALPPDEQFPVQTPNQGQYRSLYDALEHIFGRDKVYSISFTQRIRVRRTVWLSIKMGRISAMWSL
jgi:hypothetical protein